MAEEIDELIPVTVTFLEMTRPPKVQPPAPYNRQIALLRTKKIPLHFYRYLMDRVGRKWHWVNVLRLSDEELAAGLHREDRDVRVLYLDGAPAGFFDLKPHLPDEVELAYFGMMEQAMGQGIGPLVPGRRHRGGVGRSTRSASWCRPARWTIRRPCRSTRNSASRPLARRRRSCARWPLSSAWKA
jgi:hypothetical protein